MKIKYEQAKKAEGKLPSQPRKLAMASGAYFTMHHKAPVPLHFDKCFRLAEFLLESALRVINEAER